MLKWKKAAALVLAAAVAGSLAGCGEDTAYAMTIDGEDVRAGVYILYSYSAYSEAVDTLASGETELDTSDDDVVKAQVIDGVGAEQWIQDRAVEYCQEYIAIKHKCEELDVTLPEDESAYISDYIDSMWETSGSTYEDNGVSAESLEDIYRSAYLQSELFYYYYGIDGEEGVTDEEMQEFYIQNNARVRYLQFDLTDGNGEALDDNGKAEMMEMVEDYLAQLEDAQGDAEEMNAAMDTVQSEYNAYVTSISEEAAAATATTATDENGDPVTTTTTVTTTITTTTETTTTTTTATTATTGGAADADGDTTTTTAAQEDDSTETTTTTVATDANGETVTTTATTSPYANEVVVARVTTDEDTTEEDLSYTPTKNVYDYIYGDEIEMGVPAIVEDEDAYYIVVRFDIEERMTEDDLWNETNIESAIANKYGDAFQDMVDTWRDAQTVVKNDKAIKRYDPFEFELSSSV